MGGQRTLEKTEKDILNQLLIAYMAPGNREANVLKKLAALKEQEQDAFTSYVLRAFTHDLLAFSDPTCPHPNKNNLRLSNYPTLMDTLEQLGAIYPYDKDAFNQEKAQSAHPRATPFIPPQQPAGEAELSKFLDDAVKFVKTLPSFKNALEQLPTLQIPGDIVVNEQRFLDGRKNTQYVVSDIVLFGFYFAQQDVSNLNGKNAFRAWWQKNRKDDLASKYIDFFLIKKNVFLQNELSKSELKEDNAQFYFALINKIVEGVQLRQPHILLQSAQQQILQKFNIAQQTPAPAIAHQPQPVAPAIAQQPQPVAPKSSHAQPASEPSLWIRNHVKVLESLPISKMGRIPVNLKLTEQEVITRFKTCTYVVDAVTAVAYYFAQHDNLEKAIESADHMLDKCALGNYDPSLAKRIRDFLDEKRLVPKSKVEVRYKRSEDSQYSIDRMHEIVDAVTRAKNDKNTNADNCLDPLVGVLAEKSLSAITPNELKWVYKVLALSPRFNNGLERIPSNIIEDAAERMYNQPCYIPSAQAMDGVRQGLLGGNTSYALFYLFLEPTNDEQIPGDLLKRILPIVRPQIIKYLSKKTDEELNPQTLHGDKLRFLLNVVEQAASNTLSKESLRMLETQYPKATKGFTSNVASIVSDILPDIPTDAEIEAQLETGATALFSTQPQQPRVYAQPGQQRLYPPVPGSYSAVQPKVVQDNSRYARLAEPRLSYLQQKELADEIFIAMLSKKTAFVEQYPQTSSQSPLSMLQEAIEKGLDREGMQYLTDKLLNSESNFLAFRFMKSPKFAQALQRLGGVAPKDMERFIDVQRRYADKHHASQLFATWVIHDMDSFRKLLFLVAKQDNPVGELISAHFIVTFAPEMSQFVFDMRKEISSHNQNDRIIGNINQALCALDHTTYVPSNTNNYNLEDQLRGDIIPAIKNAYDNLKGDRLRTGFISTINTVLGAFKKETDYTDSYIWFHLLSKNPDTTGLPPLYRRIVALVKDRVQKYVGSYTAEELAPRTLHGDKLFYLFDVAKLALKGKLDASGLKTLEGNYPKALVAEWFGTSNVEKITESVKAAINTEAEIATIEAKLPKGQVGAVNVPGTEQVWSRRPRSLATSAPQHLFARVYKDPVLVPAPLYPSLAPIAPTQSSDEDLDSLLAELLEPGMSDDDVRRIIAAVRESRAIAEAQHSLSPEPYNPNNPEGAALNRHIAIYRHPVLDSPDNSKQINQNATPAERPEDAEQRKCPETSPGSSEVVGDNSEPAAKRDVLHECLPGTAFNTIQASTESSVTKETFLSKFPHVPNNDPAKAETPEGDSTSMKSSEKKAVPSAC